MSSNERKSFSIGQMNQLAKALQLAGFSSYDITKLGQHPDLKNLKGWVRKELRFTSLEKDIFKLGAETPNIPEGFKIFKNVEVEPFNIKKSIQLLDCYNTGDGPCDKYVSGLILYSRIQKMTAVSFPNAKVLDFFLEKPELIPRCLKSVGVVVFWGTIFVKNSELFIRGLRWDGFEQICKSVMVCLSDIFLDEMYMPIVVDTYI